MNPNSHDTPIDREDNDASPVGRMDRGRQRPFALFSTSGKNLSNYGFYSALAA
jgi:hypothetical protein